MEGGREGGREGREGREVGREGWRGMEGGREGGWEGWRDGHFYFYLYYILPTIIYDSNWEALTLTPPSKLTITPKLAQIYLVKKSWPVGI